MEVSLYINGFLVGMASLLASEHILSSIDLSQGNVIS